MQGGALPDQLTLNLAHINAASAHPSVYRNRCGIRVQDK
jgi:hypothetical protein